MKHTDRRGQLSSLRRGLLGGRTSWRGGPPHARVAVGQAADLLPGSVSAAVVDDDDQLAGATSSRTGPSRAHRASRFSISLMAGTTTLSSTGTLAAVPSPCSSASVQELPQGARTELRCFISTESRPRMTAPSARDRAASMRSGRAPSSLSACRSSLKVGASVAPTVGFIVDPVHRARVGGQPWSIRACEVDRAAIAVDSSLWCSAGGVR